MSKQEPDYRKIVDEYVIPGVKRYFQDEIEKALERIKQELGYEEVLTYVAGKRQVLPRFSVHERIQALAEHLKIEFTSEEPKPRKVIAVKK